MRILFKNGSYIKATDASEDVCKSKPKTFQQTKWVLGYLYKSLKWHQKLRLRFYFFMYRFK